jgi:hypothetical protein
MLFQHAILNESNNYTVKAVEVWDRTEASHGGTFSVCVTEVSQAAYHSRKAQIDGSAVI